MFITLQYYELAIATSKTFPTLQIFNLKKKIKKKLEKN